MRAGQLSNPAIVELLRPFVVTSWHGAGEADMPADVKDIFTQSGITKESNVLMFVLDPQGQLVHGFNAVGGGARGKEGASDSKQEITKAIGKLKLADTPDAPDVQSLQGVVEGDYLYRIRGTQTIPLIAAIESRPERRSPTTK